MGVLEQVTEMKRNGLPESEIISNLQQQRISPREINEALNQSQIKNAIAGENQEMSPPMAEEAQVPAPQENYAPQTQEIEAPTPGQYPPPEPQAFPPQNFQEQDSPEQEYYGQETVDYSSSTETDTMIEIAEQVYSEKIKDLQKQLDKLNEFSTLAGTKLTNAVERIKKIETTIDKLQLAILDKVGSYGQNLESIKKEMSMMQDSFRKVTKKKTTTKATKTKKKK